jgi:ABC-2 type transport system ATP-binding protein
MAALIKIENLNRYYGDLCAVNGVSFELERGEILGFLGPNGAGKSTTMQMIAGGLAPSSGNIQLNGIDLLQQPARAKQHLGYLPEQPPLYNDLTVDEYLNFCARLQRLSGSEVGAAVGRVKERCGLEPEGGRLIANLSKGYRQRVGIAQALIHDPDTIILDEPTSGLDPNQIREIRQLIKQLGEEHGILLSTHILPEVETICDRVLILHQGRLVFSDRVDRLNQHNASPHLLITLARPPQQQELAQLPGVAAVEPLTEGRFRLQLDSNEAAESIAEQSINRGWGLCELTPDRTGLEQTFTQLTTAEAE